LVLDEIGGPRASVVAPKLEQLTREDPDVVLDITTDGRPLVFVAGRFDAGIHRQRVYRARHDRDVVFAINARPS
jgi:DNA-binding transcriptional LysR family regulator